MPLSPVIVPPRAQASRRCETQAPLSGKPPSCAKRFGPLTPSARSGNLIVGDGTKNGLPAPNKELAINRKQPLDRKSPIQVACEPDFREAITRCGGRCRIRSDNWNSDPHPPISAGAARERGRRGRPRAAAAGRRLRTWKSLVIGRRGSSLSAIGLQGSSLFLAV